MNPKTGLNHHIKPPPHKELKADLPLTRIRKVLRSNIISWMKGVKIVSNLGDIISTGGTRMVTFFLIGGFRIIVHLEISGSWSFRIRIVFFVAVAVIIKTFPFKLLSSPVDNAIAGRKADLDFESFLSPQLATAKEFC